MSSIVSQLATSAESQNQHWKHQSSSVITSCDNNAAIYKIVFDVDHVGKNKPASKRMASWKYGVSRSSSTGEKCDEIIEEHEAKLVWSTHSGRYAISIDGTDVYANSTKGSVLDYKWKWNHSAGCIVDQNDDLESMSMRIVACRKPPNRSSKDFRCYEFLIDGKIFRDLPQMNGRNNHLDDNYSCLGMNLDFQNEDSEEICNDNGRLTSIFDIVEPGWRSTGFA